MITQAIKTIVKILPKVSHELFAQRLKVCALCPSRKVHKGAGWTCGTYLLPGKNTCGCIVREKAKLKGFNCPQNKWPKEN